MIKIKHTNSSVLPFIEIQRLYAAISTLSDLVSSHILWIWLPNGGEFNGDVHPRWWLNQPNWKILYSQIGSFPQVEVKIKKYFKPPPSHPMGSQSVKKITLYLNISKIPTCHDLDPKIPQSHDVFPSLKNRVLFFSPKHHLFGQFHMIHPSSQASFPVHCYCKQACRGFRGTQVWG